MNSQRIRYKKLADDVLESVQTFQHKSQANHYKVRLNTKEMRLYVLDVVTELPEVTDTAWTLHQLKKKVKAALVSLGIEFSDETRKRVKRVSTQT